MIVECMSYVEKIRNLNGLERKDIAVQLCGQIFKRISGLDVTSTLSSTIDLIIDLTKGKYDINKIEKCATGCLSLGFATGKKYKK
jgi:hypothetical protein